VRRLPSPVGQRRQAVSDAALFRAMAPGGVWHAPCPGLEAPACSSTS